MILCEKLLQLGKYCLDIGWGDSIHSSLEYGRREELEGEHDFVTVSLNTKEQFVAHNPILGLKLVVIIVPFMIQNQAEMIWIWITDVMGKS